MKIKISIICVFLLTIFISRSEALTFTQKAEGCSISTSVSAGREVTLNFIGNAMYSFGKWIVEQGNVSVTQNATTSFKMPSSNVVIKAGNKCTVTLKALYGTFADGTSTKTKTVTVGEPYGEIPSVSSGVSAFWVLGWSTIESGGVTRNNDFLEDSTISNKVTSSTIVTNSNSHTLYAKWVCECCSSVFDSPGLSHSCSSEQCEECGRCTSHCICGL